MKDFIKGSLIYEGKAKKIFQVEGREDLVIHEFKDSLTAFNGEKKGNFENKGSINCSLSTLIYRYLSQNNEIPNHWVDSPSENIMVTWKLKMVPLEFVVRNRVAGSLAKRLGWEEGRELKKPILELYYKDDDLGDPFISDEHVKILEVLNENELIELKRLSFSVNEKLKIFFEKVGLDLVDFKMEFGKNKDGKYLLGDEVSPDTCRLWDIKTGEKRDKDRFRRDLGNVKENYEQVLNSTKEYWEAKL